jgi:hypothetical protein
VSICTLFNWDYAPQGLALYRSFRRYHPDDLVTVLCLDGKTIDSLSIITDPNLHLCMPPDVLPNDVLAEWQATRTRAEICWGLAAPLVYYCLTKHGGPVEYIDADCCLFSGLSNVRAEIGDAPVGIVPHRWDKEHAERLRPNGIYNVGYVYFSGGSGGLAAANGWTASNVNWRRQGNERFNDQLHLNNWPDLHGAHVIQNPGINLAPYNQMHRTYSTDWENLLVDGEQLVTYHFHEWRCEMMHEASKLRVTRTGYPLHLAVIRMAYEPYENEVAECMRLLGLT